MPFDFEQYTLDSAFATTVWRTRSGDADAFISQAVSYWELVVTRVQGRAILTLRGPETKASLAPVPADAEFWGIQFRHGSFMPHFPVSELVDTSLSLPPAAKTRVWLSGSAVELPTFEQADAFIANLVRRGELVHDPLIAALLGGEPTTLSQRTVQRRFAKATGLSPRAFQQIERSQKAVSLLGAGASIADVVYQAGYADQPHLTRSLKQLSGKTPAQLRAGAGI